MADVLTYNPFLPSVREDPYPVYQALRESDPIHRSPFMDLWLVTRYEDVEQLLRDPRLTADKRLWRSLPSLDEGYVPSMVNLDPPDHTRLRRLVSRPFASRVVEQVFPWAHQVVDEALDRAAAAGGLDLIEDLAQHVPVAVINRLLGVPAEDWPRSQYWTRFIMVSVDPLAIPDPARVAGFRAADEEFLEYLGRLVARRRREPRDDLISALVASEGEGALDEGELLSMLALLLMAGQETTVGLIGNGVLALLRHPDQMERLRDHPELLESAVEELLRYDSPGQFALRVAREDLELGGRRIGAGELVVLGLGAANRDPEKFFEPERLDLARSPNPHLSFGRGGIHFCLGAPLARVEAQVAIGELVRRFPDVRLAGEPVRTETIIMRRLSALPLELGIR